LDQGRAGPHEVDGSVLTLWHYCHSDSVGEKPELGQTLRTFHASLADFPEPLSPFTEKVDDGASLFGSERATPALDRGDRKLALRVHEALIRDLGADSSQWLKLHGEPHEGNVAWAKSRPVFIDFEAACFGPLEWDLAYLPDEAMAAFPTRDDELLAVLRIAVSFCVAAWCWAQPNRAPEVWEAAQFHLSVLRHSRFAR
jgi:Ser/Thr protein kinase RdoA (MazF antagonist)